MDYLHLPPNYVGHITHGKNEGHDGDGDSPFVTCFALKRICGIQYYTLCCTSTDKNLVDEVRNIQSDTLVWTKKEFR